MGSQLQTDILAVLAQLRVLIGHPRFATHTDLQDMLMSNHDLGPEQSSHITSSLDILIYVKEEIQNLSVELQYKIAQQKALVAPIRVLPDDILRVIFEKAATNSWKVTDPRALPWTLTRVCRRWYDVVVSTPSLWSSICIDNTRSSSWMSIPWASKRLAELVNLCLHRSTGYPLSVDFMLDGILDLTGMMNIVASVLRVHSHRCKKIGLHFGRSLGNVEIPAEFGVLTSGGQFPVLRELHISDKGHPPRPEFLNCIVGGMFSAAPLEIIRIAVPITHWQEGSFMDKVNLALVRIAHIEMGIPDQNFLSILSRASRLVQLTTTVSPTSLARFGTITNPFLTRSLRQLTCKAFQLRFMIPIKLKDFDVEIHRREDVKYLQDFFDERACHGGTRISSLTLRGNLRASQMLETLKAALKTQTALVNFFIHDLGIEEVITGVSTTEVFRWKDLMFDDGHCILPRLERISFQCSEEQIDEWCEISREMKQLRRMKIIVLGRLADRCSSARANLCGRINERLGGFGKTMKVSWSWGLLP